MKRVLAMILALLCLAGAAAADTTLRVSMLPLVIRSGADLQNLMSSPSNRAMVTMVMVQDYQLEADSFAADLSMPTWVGMTADGAVMTAVCGQWGGYVFLTWRPGSQTQSAADDTGITDSGSAMSWLAARCASWYENSSADLDNAMSGLWNAF